MPSVQELESHGHPTETKSRLWFDLRLRPDFFEQWKGKLTIKWPGREINWHRFADRAVFKITAIHAQSLLNNQPPDSYRDWDLEWDQLKLLPESWRTKLRARCGIYYIFDVSDGRGYVGKASGKQNLLGRWMDYADSGDGGNQKLRGRDPLNLRFSILELIPEDMEGGEVERHEQSWMLRLRTRTRTHGLNLPELDY
ncbi:MAG: GIY-YIG nuclease family protein [Candidatus Acidiferrales bacterium]